MNVNRIDLSSEIQDWKDAICGEEVRDANIRAFEKIQSSVNETVDNVNQAVEDIGTATTGANDAVKRANEAINDAKNTLEQAKEYSGNAAKSVEEAEAWAHGRDDYPDREIDNSKYWSIRSQTSANEAKNEADRASAYANYIEPKFLYENNRVYVNANSTVSFALHENRLYFKLPA